MFSRFLFYFSTFVLTLILGPLGQARAESQNSAFGKTESSEAALIGIFYDLKQNQQRQPVVGDYLKIVGEFLNSGWDEGVLNPYFRGATALYATDVFIPKIDASAAPKAFGLGGIVKPRLWCVVYKGQVSPPEDGTYRFVGVADDLLAVAVNGKTCLVSNFQGIGSYSSWKEPDPKSAIPTDPYRLRKGDWFECKKGDIIDLDILIGECPGSLFGAWLLIEKQGVDYPYVEGPKGGKLQVLPVFQVVARTISKESQPVPFSTNAAPWICHQ